MSPQKPIVILGCTASGKSDLAEALALRLGPPGSPAPLIAVDSMQVYRTMDIGTAKPTAETRQRLPYHMLDVVDPWQSYSTARFINDAHPLLQTLTTPILVAGTFLYLRSLIQGLFEGPSADEALRAELHERAKIEGSEMLHAELLRVDPPAGARIHPNDLRRIIRALEVFRLTGTPISAMQTQWSQEHPALKVIYIGIRRDKDLLSRRINARVRKMVELGLVDEVHRLFTDPRGFSDEAKSAVGYRQLIDHFERRCSLEEAIEQIKIQTRALAKMQRTWLKRWPPPTEVHWLDAPEGTEGADLADQALSLIGKEPAI